MVNLRTPLVVTGPVTGGVPDLRAPLLVDSPVTGGVPALRGALLASQPLTGGVPKLRCSLIVVQAVVPIPEPLPVATIVFPALKQGAQWDRKKEPEFNNARRSMTSGLRAVTPFMQYPRWNFELSYDYLPDAPYSGLVLSDVRAVADLFIATQGGAQAFLYADKDDFHVVGGAIATADGVTLQWPFAAPIMSAQLQPVGQLDLSTLATFASSAVDPASDEIHIPGHGMTTGQYPPMFIANTGGALPTPLAAITPYWPIVVDADHIKLATTHANAIGGTAINITAAGSGTDTLAKGYAVYDNGTIVNPASASLTLPNQLVFGSAPTATHAITADFDYYFVCRFDADKLELNQFMSTLWDLQKLDFSSDIPPA